MARELPKPTNGPSTPPRIDWEWKLVTRGQSVYTGSCSPHATTPTSASDKLVVCYVTAVINNSKLLNKTQINAPKFPTQEKLSASPHGKKEVKAYSGRNLNTKFHL